MVDEQSKMQGYSVQGISDRMSERRNVYCPKHENHLILKFCHECNDVTCDTCVDETHMGHNISDVHTCAEKVFNLFLDRSKQLDGPFCKLKKSDMDIERNARHLEEKCDTVEGAILQRKENLIKMISNIADEAIDEVRSTKKQVRNQYADTMEQLDCVIKDCDVVTTPLIKGAGVDDMLRLLVSFTHKITDAENILSTIKLMGKHSDVKLDDDCEGKIEDCTKEYFIVKHVNILKPQLAPITKPSILTNYSPARMGTSSIASVSHRPMPARKESNIINKIPNQVHLVNKTDMKSSYFISKHITCSSYLAQHHSTGPIQRFSYIDAAKILDAPPKYKPKPSTVCGRSILTIRDDRHVIISKEAINLCDNRKVIRSVPHGTDWYIADIIGYYDQEKFVTVCKRQKKMRYYDVNTLDVVCTHSLRTELNSDLDKNDSVLCTSTGDILLQTGKQELAQFTAEGVMKTIVPIDSAYYECHPASKCIDKYNTILGVWYKDGSIHAFSVLGEHRILGKVENLKYVWGAGVDQDSQLYVTFNDTSNTDNFAKYKYSES